MFLLRNSLEQGRNLKLIIITFELMSGLKINFHESEVYYFEDAANRCDLFSEIFTYPIRKLPMMYLGIPLTIKISVLLNGLKQKKRWKMLGVWQGRCMSMGD